MKNPVLTNAPLVRVLCQVRWPRLAKFDLEAVSQVLAETVGDLYPLVDKKREIEIVMTGEGLQQNPSGDIYVLRSADGTWTVSLGDTFLALETSSYVGHEDFLGRLGSLLDVLSANARIPAWQRLGYRYTNRIVGEGDLNELSKWFSQGALGIDATEVLGLRRAQSVSESVFVDDTGGRLLLRSAHLPANASVDPSLPAVTEASWVLDIDAFDERTVQGFDAHQILQVAAQLSNRGHEAFWGLVTPEFTERFK
jgi:uncharacterized protein (TIGR04255 family)